MGKKGTIVAINLGNYGSTGTIMGELLSSAKESGFEVYSAYPETVFNKPKEENDIIICSGFFNRLNRGLGSYTGYIGCFSFFHTILFLRKLSRIKPDVIHLHNIHSSYINHSMLFKYIKKHNIPVVWTLHDCWSFTGQCAYFDFAGCEKWKTGCGNCEHIDNYPRALVDRTKTMFRLKKKWFSGVENMTLVTPSQWLADLTKESFLKEYPLKVINNGINLSVFKPIKGDFRKKYNLEGKFILLGVAFGWGVRKGLDIFVELSKRINDNFRIVLVGIDENTEKQLPENIIAIRRTQNQSELAEIYTAADLFVNPTREDNYPTVNMESIACGTPVLTFDTGGSSESLDNSCGCVVPKDDVDELFGEIMRIYKERPYSETDCMQRAKSFDKNRKNQEYIDLYNNIIGVINGD